MTIRVTGLACALFLAACATTPPQQMAWQRVDGQRFSDAQLQADTAFCRGEVSKANLSDAARAGDNWIPSTGALNRVMEGCMGGRGYILVPAN
jgi:hypothetical protein